MTAALLFGALSNRVSATDIPHGQQLYSTWSAGCHRADPRASQPRLAAGNPAVLKDAIGLVSEMHFLDDVLSGADIDDIAAWIGSVADAGVVVLNPTPIALDFSAQDVGTASIGKALLLTNLGSTPVTIESVVASPTDFSLSWKLPRQPQPEQHLRAAGPLYTDCRGTDLGQGHDRVRSVQMPMTVPLLGAGVLPATAPLPVVVEYHEPELDHYFITADAGEQAFVDSGAVGRWLRTGNAFRSGGSAQVCRFHGNTALAASGARFGPNSHFYTADPPECDWLKANFDADAPPWKFESLDFSTSPPSGGLCPAGTVPVWRAYNDGNRPGVDSNHRITTNRTAIDQVVARGWIDEGLVMCAPQALQ